MFIADAAKTDHSLLFVLFWLCRKIKKLVTLLDLCVSSLRRGHANLLCIVPILTDDLLRGSIQPSVSLFDNKIAYVLEL